MLIWITIGLGLINVVGLMGLITYELIWSTRQIEDIIRRQDDRIQKRMERANEPRPHGDETVRTPIETYDDAFGANSEEARQFDLAIMGNGSAPRGGESIQAGIPIRH